MPGSLFHSLYARIAIVLAMIFAVIGFFFIYLMGMSSERYQQEVAQRLNRDLAANLISDHFILEDGQVRQEALKAIFHDLMVVNPQIPLKPDDMDRRWFHKIFGVKISNRVKEL